MKVLIYCPFFSNRLEYIVQFIFEEQLGLVFELTKNLQSFKDFKGPKVNYSNERVSDNEVFINAEKLLLNQGISLVQPSVSRKNNRFLCFTNDKDDLGFDIFAASFYFISRYEEYLPFVKDAHGRFEAKQSFAFQHGVLREPLVDQWILMLKEKLSSTFPELSFPIKKFSCIPSIDIDQCFAIQEKGILRFINAVLNALKKFDFKDLYYLISVRLKLKKDPFDVYDTFEQIHDKLKLQAIYFILFSKRLTRFDKNISRTNSSFKNILKELSKRSTIGIHPSYYSKSSSKIIESEVHSLSLVINNAVNSSRQHFLKLRLPNTYKSLISIGIENEYSMGYASQPGFRAGTSNSFRFYDLKHEQVTFLRVHPFCCMDTTFNTYLKSNPDDALIIIMDIIDKIKEVDGCFIPLWHNESLSEYKEWVGWSGLYEKVLEYAMITKR